MNSSERFNRFIRSTTVNINGKITPSEQAKISIFDRAFLFGDSVYEVAYSEEGQLLFFDEHLDRLYNSASLLNMNIFISREEIKDQIIKTLKHSNITRAYMRLIITRGETEINLDPNISFKNNFVIIIKPQPEYPEINYTRGLDLVISSVLRNDRKSVNPNAKSGNYLNNVMALSEAKKLGFDDAIMVNSQGLITEGTTFNIWIVKSGVIKTPPETSGLLKGITREKVLEICKSNQFNYEITDLRPEDILEADEVFITSSTKGIMPIYKVNDHTYPTDRPIIQNLSLHYKEVLKQQKVQAKYKYI